MEKVERVEVRTPKPFCLRSILRRFDSGEAEVGKFEAAVDDENIGRLDVSMNGEYMPLFRAFVEICKCIEEIGDFQEHPRSQILDSLRFVRFISTPPRLEAGLVH
jgi:hypothetical protein